MLIYEICVCVCPKFVSMLLRMDIANKGFSLFILSAILDVLCTLKGRLFLKTGWLNILRLQSLNIAAAIRLPCIQGVHLKNFPPRYPLKCALYEKMLNIKVSIKKKKWRWTSRDFEKSIFAKIDFTVIYPPRNSTTFIRHIFSYNAHFTRYCGLRTFQINILYIRQMDRHSRTIRFHSQRVFSSTSHEIVGSYVANNWDN